MEFVQELFFTAFVTLVFSFLVAKLVSMAVAGDVGRDSRKNDLQTVVEEEKFGRELRVQSNETGTGVRFIEEVVAKVDKFEGERSDRVQENLQEVPHGGDVVEACYAGDQIEVVESVKEVSVVVGLPETSSEMISEAEVEGEEEAKVTCLDGNKKAVEFDDGIGEEGTTTTGSDGLVVEEHLVEDGENQGKGNEGEVNQGDEEKEVVASDEDDWEGIERSELEKLFAAAANYVGYGCKEGRLADLGSDLQMQLYGLQRVAMEGPCYEPQPMALKLTARAKWNSWQKLGNMSSEDAMEQYVALLSDTIPGWVEAISAGEDKQDSSGSRMHDTPTFLNSIQNSTRESEVALKSSTDGDDGNTVPNSLNKDKE